MNKRKKKKVRNEGRFAELISRCETFGPFVAVKRRYIVMFVVVWNVLCGIGVLLNVGTGEITAPASMIMLMMAGAYAAFCGFAPLCSQRIRTRWCKKDADFKAARSSFILVGVIATLMCVVLAIMFIQSQNSSS
jgi:Na+/proline symporter